MDEQFMVDLNRLTIADLVTIKQALLAYMDHLNPSASYVREVAEWREKVSLVENKICNILLSNKE